MTNYEIYRNNIIREYIDYGSRMHINCIRHDPASSDKHKDKVEDICRILRKNHVDFICRAVMEVKCFINIKFSTVIPDIFAFTQPKPTVIEVIDTETEDHVKEKLQKYPDEFRKLFINVTQKLFELDIV